MKTVLQATSATIVFTPGVAGAGTLDFTNFFSTAPFVINRLMAVINQTRNTIIYAEAQTGLGWTSWNPSSHVLTLNSDTSTHAATDILQVIYDSPATAVVPIEEYFDPVNKSRVSTPQSLIDTDFEYGVQSTKWETVNLINNRPTAFYEPIVPMDPAAITAMNTTAGSRIINVTCNSTVGVSGVAIGTPIFVQDTIENNANGWFAVSSVTTNTNFLYVAKAPMTSTGNILDLNRTLIYPGNFYTGSGIPLGVTNAFTNVGTAITCTTQYAHGLYTGDPIYVLGTTTTNGQGSPSGAWVVASTPNATQFTFNVINTPGGAIANTVGSVNLYARPGGYSIHRAYDGGVQFSSGSGQPNAQTVRQTRKYFRYQSGKGVQFSTGSILRPSFQLNTLSAADLTLNATISGICKVPHGMQPGSQISVTESTDSAYNGTYEVRSVPNELTFTYASSGTPTNLQAQGFPIFAAPGPNWGCTVRLGMFDQQNGLFFEHDGQDTYLVRRGSVQQIAGTVNITTGTNTVNGINTLFSNQLIPGDFIVIKGMSYRVQSIASNTLLYILPEYRGPTITNGIVTKTIDTRIRQDQWNIDRLDGTGPSGYILNPNKMQMFYIDYSWYGAGFIRWGIRANNGNVHYVHKMLNNNINAEAYMRSGNLPARYEEHNFCPSTILTQTLNSGDATMYVSNVSAFPPAGTVRVTTPGTTSSATIEYIRYSTRNLSTNTLTGLSRAQTGGNGVAQTFTYAAQAPTQVELVGTSGGTASSNVPPAMAISHWGSSVIMDGRFDDDLNFAFNAGAPTALNITPVGTRNAILSIRLAPSVDSGRTGLLGVREIINRMQLRLRAMDILCSAATTAYRIEVILNGRLSGATAWQNVGGSSLAQVAYHPAGVTVTGGENVFGFFHYGGSSYQDLTQVRELGNSTLGGGIVNTVSTTASNMYPDGPDILTIVGTLLVAGNIQSRLSWTEAQA